MTEDPTRPTPPSGQPALVAAAADESGRLSDRLLVLHQQLAATAEDNPSVRAAWFRLQDAAYTCRRAAAELSQSRPGARTGGRSPQEPAVRQPG